MSSRLLYLSRADVERVGPDMRTIIDLLDAAYREKAAGRVEMPPKPGVHPGPDNFIHAMPAYLPELRAAGLKWVAGFPRNPAVGLPYITGLIVLNDVETGLAYAVMDCAWITAQRTGAASALSARHLARPDSRTLGILGCGVQGRTHLEALSVLFSLQRVLAYDTVRAHADRFAREQARAGLAIEVVDNARRAVEESDLVVTAGPILRHPRPTIDRDWLQPGAFATAVDYDSYWTAAALAQIDKLATDDVPQLEHSRKLGYFRSTPHPYADLGELVAGLKPGRQRADERTLAMNLGLALNDLAVAPEVYRRARDRGVGAWLPL
jgi:ornithine cyclodeaminase/alanine dehydrogenase